MNWKRIACAAALAAASAPCISHAQDDFVWRVGAFDGSSGEFSGNDPRGSVVFEVAKDKPQTNWYRYQPAATAGQASTGADPRTIAFSLDAKPGPSYHFRASLLIEESSVPALRVGINGRTGLFYLHPKLDYKMGDVVAAFYPAYSRAEVEFNFPGAWLKHGANTITVQAVALADKEVPDAGFAWDAIELTRGDASPRAIEAHAEPTIFFTKRENGLKERVDVFVRTLERPRTGRVDLTLGGQTLSQAINGKEDFGEERVSFDVAEFAPQTRAKISVKSNGRTEESTEVLDPQKTWTLYMVPHVHLDVGYTDDQAKVSAIQSRILDEAMDLTEKRPDFRFSTDGEWNLDQFLKSRTPAEQQRILAAIKKEQVYIPAQSANLLTGFPTAETLIRSLYPSANFSREHGSPFNYANITDVPSYSWSYASILAAAGIPYFFAGSNNDRAPVLLQGHLNENTPFWWQGPDGGKVLMWYSRHYMQMQFLFGLPPLTGAGEEVLPLFLQMYQHPSYRANAAIIFGTQVENTDLFPQQGELAEAWNAKYAYPHLQVSGFHDALEAIAHEFGDNIPTVRGDGGPYWEDGIGSDALYAAMERENESRAPSAEKLATISTLVNPQLAVNHDELNSMWENMVLMDEHTWLSWNSVSDPESDQAKQQLRIKDSRAIEAASQRDDILRSSMAALADSTAAGVGSLLVFNTLNWARDGQVILDLDNGTEIQDRTTGKTVPYLLLHQGPNYRRVEFRAESVPAVGYRVYELRSASHEPPPTQHGDTRTLENAFYRIELDGTSGSIRSVFDKQLNKELVDTKSPWRFGQYLYVSGGDEEPNSVLQYRAISPKPDLHVHAAESGRIVSVEQTPWGSRALLESSTVNTPSIRTEVRLFDDDKKIELVEDIDKKEELKKEAVYFAFPFAMDHPQFQYEIQNGVVDPAKDMYPGAGYEWFSVQHWAAVEQDRVSAAVMPLDASLLTLGDINRGAWPTEFGRRPGAIFSYAMNNYWHTNYRAAQGGHFRFRYVITSAAHTDSAALSRRGWLEATPLEQDEIRSQDKALDLPRSLDGKQQSFVSIEDKEVVLDTWKPAEDGNGTIMRLIDLGGSARDIKVETPLLALAHVKLTDAVERDGKDLNLAGPHAFTVSMTPHQIVTLRLLPVSKQP